MQNRQNPEVFRARRQKLLNRLGGAPLLLRSAAQVVRNGDVHHPWRQSSDFYYLTGFDEPKSALLAIPERRGSHRAILFVRPRDKEREVWDGKRAGVAGAKRDHGADEAYAIGELFDVLDELSARWDRVALVLAADPDFDRELIAHFEKRFTGRPRKNRWLPTFVDPRPFLHEQRLVKDSSEIFALERACAITCDGHRVAMALARPGMHEYEVQAELEAVFRRGGSPRNGYDSIVASGPNACTLHYTKNDRKIHRGDLCLIDAAAEVGQLSADVTRTFPVTGRYSEAQRAVYARVLRVQKKCIRMVRPGVTVKRILETSQRELTKALVELGVLRGNPARLFDKNAFKPWYMHGLGHWLGMDVHDVGAYEDLDGKSVRLTAGQVMTVEPGLYLAANDKRVPKELRGIGVRIEDDVLVTRGGHRVLTEAAPKEIREVEELCANGS